MITKEQIDQIADEFTGLITVESFRLFKKLHPRAGIIVTIDGVEVERTVSINLKTQSVEAIVLNKEGNVFCHHHGVAATTIIVAHDSFNVELVGVDE